MPELLRDSGDPMSHHHHGSRKECRECQLQDQVARLEWKIRWLEQEVTRRDEAISMAAAVWCFLESISTFTVTDLAEVAKECQNALEGQLARFAVARVVMTHYIERKKPRDRRKKIRIRL
jgi:hypothetical protein